MKKEILNIRRLILLNYRLLWPMTVNSGGYLDSFWLGKLDGNFIVNEGIVTVSNSRILILWPGSLVQNLTSGR